MHPVKRTLVSLAPLVPVLVCGANRVHAQQVLGREPGYSVCANCSEGYYFGRPAHWWHGEDGCDEPSRSPGCRVCDASENYCYDPLVPHEGNCPAANCGQTLAEVSSAVKGGDIVALATYVEDGRADFDEARALLDLRTCGGATVQIDLDRHVSRWLGQTLAQRAAAEWIRE